MSASDLFFGSCFLLLVLAGSFAGGEIVFAPLRRAERAVGGSHRFLMADLFVLVVQLQLAAGAVLAAVPSHRGLERALAIVFAWAIVFCWWAHGVALLAEAGAGRPTHRALFLGLVGPVGILGVLLLTLLTPALVTVAFIVLIAMATGDGSLPELQLTLLLSALAAGAAVLLAMAIGARMASHWLVRAARAEMALERQSPTVSMPAVSSPVVSAPLDSAPFGHTNRL